MVKPLKLIMEHPIRSLAIIAFIVYWVLVQFVPLSILGELVNALLLAVSVSVCIVFGPRAYQALRRKDGVDDTEQLILGICCVFLGSFLIWSWALIGRVFMFTTRLVDSPVTGSLIWLIIFGGVLHLTAIDAADSKLRVGNWRLLLAAACVGCTIAGLIVGLAIGK